MLCEIRLVLPRACEIPEMLIKLRHPDLPFIFKTTSKSYVYPHAIIFITDMNVT